MSAPQSETPEFGRIAVFGGIYDNYLALESALADARRRNVDAIFCLGDMGAFGPYPDRVFPLLREHGVRCIQGNYDNSIGNELADCQCGYTDPRDNHFARISYDYTFRNTSPTNRAWLRDLPLQRRLQLCGLNVLLCHGSPRKMNEFLWESTTPTHFLEHLAEQHNADVILATHTGIKWHRRLSRNRHFINVGVLGRPENDGRTNVWYTILDGTGEGHPETPSPLAGEGRGERKSTPSPLAGEGRSEGVSVEFIPIEYDHHQLAADMRAEKLPEEFVETVLTGWWTTCLEILPAKERRRGRF